jgi:hypothetical protein
VSGADAAARPVVVWEAGGALLAVPLEDTIEVTDVDRDGRALSREGRLELSTPPGLVVDRPVRAIVVRHPDGPLALAAGSVEGVCEATGTTATPPWLEGLAVRHMDGLVVLDDGRIAALLATRRLDGP